VAGVGASLFSSSITLFFAEIRRTDKSPQCHRAEAVATLISIQSV
jgi:hypothetical protein